MRDIIAVVDRPKDIEDAEAMSFFRMLRRVSGGFNIGSCYLLVLAVWQALRPTTRRTFRVVSFPVQRLLKIRW
jgi:hypothetical protein